jgi:hypothetical protein
MGVGGKRAGAGRPPGSPGLKSLALAGRLDAMGCDPAEALARLGAKAEAAGDTDLAIKAYTALMPFRWPKLKETAIDLGLGLSGSLAGRLQEAQARLQITVVSGIDRPPDDAGASGPQLAELPPTPPSSAVTGATVFAATAGAPTGSTSAITGTAGTIGGRGQTHSRASVLDPPPERARGAVSSQRLRSLETLGDPQSPAACRHIPSRACPVLAAIR